MRRYCNKLELSKEEKERIKKRYKECKGKRIAERLLCLLMKAGGQSHEIVSNILGGVQKLLKRIGERWGKQIG